MPPNRALNIWRFSHCRRLWACFIVCAVLLLSLVFFATPESTVQGEHPQPVSPGQTPLAPPPLQFRASPTPLPQGTEGDDIADTPPLVSPEPDSSTKLDSTAQPYYVRGDLTVTSRLSEHVIREQYGEYEVFVVPNSNARGMDRLVRLTSYRDDGDRQMSTLYEIGSAAVLVFGPDRWLIQSREPATPLAQALQPVMDLADLAYTLCRSAGTDAPAERESAAIEDCRLADSTAVADFLSSSGTPARVSSSQMDVRLDPSRSETLRYRLAAELDAVSPDQNLQPILAHHSIEWTYERLNSWELTQIGWPSSVPRVEELEAPGFAPGELPAPDRILAISSIDDVLQIHMALPIKEAGSVAADSLQSRGWNVEELSGGYLANKEDETIILLLSEGERPGTSYLYVMRTD